MPEEGQENQAKGRVLEIEKMAILREKLTSTRRRKIRDPGQQKTLFRKQEKCCKRLWNSRFGPLILRNNLHARVILRLFKVS